jgi:hypothetical protein
MRNGETDAPWVCCPIDEADKNRYSQITECPRILSAKKENNEESPETLLAFSCPSSHGLPKLKSFDSPHVHDHVLLLLSLGSISKYLQGMNSQTEMKVSQVTSTVLHQAAYRAKAARAARPARPIGPAVTMAAPPEEAELEALLEEEPLEEEEDDEDEPV